METTSDALELLPLKKALEWELSLDSRDLRSHAWYHGPISRQRSEEIVQKDGDFLVRDCTSQPGNYVLTCRTKAAVLHFVINKIIIQPETVYERIQYQFEDDAYDTISDLITFYVGSEKPISYASGARIQFPCNRTYPLTFCENKVNNHFHGHAYTSIRAGNYNNYRSPLPSPPRIKRDIPPRLPTKKQRSQSLIPIQAIASPNFENFEKYCSADGVIQNTSLSTHLPEVHRSGSSEKFYCTDFHSEECVQNEDINDIMIRSNEEKASNSGGGINYSGGAQMMSRSAGLNKDIGDNSLSLCFEQNMFVKTEGKAPSPPPKPVRKREMVKDIFVEQHPLNRVASYHASGSDSGNGSGDSAQSSAPGDQFDTITHRGVFIKNPKFMSNSTLSMTLKSFTDFDIIAATQNLANMDIPIFEEVSNFDVENFHTILLPTIDNQPLDNNTVNTFRMMIAENGPRILAQHITRIDINLILGDLNVTSNNYDCLHCSGLELLTLPQGRLFRKDLIERTQCLKVLVAISILTCQSDFERAEILNKWIQVAVDIKTAIGNLFGFCAIMLGLCMPQIQKLDSTWHILRQNFTDSAFNFEAKLRPTLKSMNDCSNPQAPNTTVPHLLPYILVKDRGIEDILIPTQAPHLSLITTCVNSWEMSTDDFGLSILFSHLDAARTFTRNYNLYKTNARIVIEDSNFRLDELLLDFFRTEFHMKFLWGSEGALAASEYRHAKLEHILTLMAEKFCGVGHIECTG